MEKKKKEKKTPRVDDSQDAAVCSTALRKPSYQDARGSSWFLQRFHKKTKYAYMNENPILWWRWDQSYSGRRDKWEGWCGWCWNPKLSTGPGRINHTWYALSRDPFMCVTMEMSVTCSYPLVIYVVLCFLAASSEKLLKLSTDFRIGLRSFLYVCVYITAYNIRVWLHNSVSALCRSVLREKHIDRAPLSLWLHCSGCS